MSEENNAEAPEDTEAEEAQPLQEVGEQKDYKADVPGATDYKAKYEGQLKVNRDLEKKVKGDAGTLQDQLAEARKESESNATKALRYEVAAETGLPLEAAVRLTGATKEELTADAAKLQSLLGTSTREAFAPGRHPDPEAKPSPNDLLRAALRST